MDNMLYIIAGLVLILLVAVLVLRKNKAQKPPEQRPIQTGRNAAANAPTSTHNAERHSTAQRDPNSVNKFDHLAIAQRFMDQQRYDKAIETLDRGLIEKPDDNQLLLKLLSVYATLDQPDGFYRVYDAIKAHSDAATIAEADELKSLVAEEQNQPMSSAIPAADSNNDNDDFESLDFDLPTGQTGSKDSTDNNVDDTFKLTLGDLEFDANDPVATNLTPVDQVDTTEEESSVTTDDYLITPATNDPATNDLAIIESTEDDDFTLDFDLPTQASTPTDSTSVDTAADNSSSLEEISLDDEDFVLDFADLAADADIDTGMVTGTDNDNESNAGIDTPAQATENDFTLSLEDTDLSDVENKLKIDAPATVKESSYSENTSITPTTSPTFDDNTFIDDDFDFDFELDTTPDSPTVTTPVEDITSGFESDTEKANDSVDAETAADFASRFAADFDFVKTLDSSQVTLDLASQYLKLGEYDSAKRLLNEVMTQGNDEQQSQAQALLNRTA